MTEFDGSRFDAVERLRRKWEQIKAAEDGSGGADGGGSNVVRLPRPPRRVGEENRGGQRPGLPEAVSDPAPTRPVTRAELQSETGAWPADPSRAQPDLPAGGEGTVVDFDPSRRRRADPAPGGARPRITPRRVGKPGEGGSTPPGGSDR